MREVTIGKNLTGGTSNLVYTVPKGCTAIATLLFISNYTGSTKAVTATWYDFSSSTTITIAGDSSLGNGEILQFNQGRMVMSEYDYLTITPEAGATMSVIFTVEVNQNTTYQHGD